MSKAVTEIDVVVGARLRVRRLELDLSQQEVARKLGITFQQVQKYESGSNRMSAGRLKELSTILKVPVGYFFAEEDADSTGGSRLPTTAKLMNEPGARTLLTAYAKIQNRALRKSIVEIVRSLARDKNEDSNGEAQRGEPRRRVNRMGRA